MQETVPRPCFLAEFGIVEGAEIINERVFLHEPPASDRGATDDANTKPPGVVAQGKSFQYLHEAFDVGRMIEGADEA